MEDILDILERASARGKLSADNGNYQCGVTIDEVDKAIREIE